MDHNNIVNCIYAMLTKKIYPRKKPFVKPMNILVKFHYNLLELHWLDKSV